MKRHLSVLLVATILPACASGPRVLAEPDPSSTGAAQDPSAPAPAPAADEDGGWGIDLPKAGTGAGRYHSPITQPTIFENPAIEREVRPVFMHHRFPSDGIFGGGDLQLYALQIRVPLTERLAIIATKDGYIDFNPNNGGDDEGWADVAAGVKYALYDDPDHGILITPGLIFETTLGQTEVLQGNGDGVFRPFISAGWEHEDLNVLASIGADLPVHGGQESHSIDYHVHFDYDVHEHFVPVLEFNGVTYTRNGNALPVNFEGADLVNLGASNVNGNTVVTGGFGFRVPVTADVELGAAYETPLTSREDITDDRWTIDAIIRF